MIVSITGTPATGKTETAKRLAKIMGANLISLSSLLAKKELKGRYDKNRKTTEVSAAEVRRAVRKRIVKNKINIVEGHLSHVVKCDIIVVLRTRPDVLERRMKKKKWGAEKINENVQAEVLDVITAEAVQKNRRVIEIDTTSRTPHAAAGLIKKLLNNFALQKRYRPGRIDWTRGFSDYLVKK